MHTPSIGLAKTHCVGILYMPACINIDVFDRNKTLTAYPSYSAFSPNRGGDFALLVSRLRLFPYRGIEVLRYLSHISTLCALNICILLMTIFFSPA